MKNRFNVRMITLVVFAVCATAFAIMNHSTPVTVWPFFRSFRLTSVIALSFALGAGAGMAANSLLGIFRQKRNDREIAAMPMPAEDRSRAGRP